MRLSIATYNVKCFQMANAQSIVRVLQENDIDVCGMQEVPGKQKLEQLFQGTPSPYSVIFLGPYRSYGPALVYRGDRVRVVSSALHMLTDGAKNKKSAIRVRLECGEEGMQVDVIVTHLEHKWEAQRLREVERLLRCVPEDTSRLIILGDFNALKRSDYTEEAWQEIVNVRKQNGWEKPMTDVVARMEKEGYIDALSFVNDVIVPTCRFATRVDYIFMSPQLRDNIQFCRTIVSPHNQSDHYPVSCEFLLN
jgi:endonuclease/exonuclease/phosphatase family metal-dependent hydrolase